MRHARGSWLLVGTAALAIAAAGCREPRDDRAATTETGAAEGVGADLRDGWITTKVQAKYFTEPDVRGRDIDVTTSDGVVTLAGVVDSEQARQRAIALARETDGVVRVEDRLSVGTASAADATRADTDRRADATPPAGDGNRDTVGTGGSDAGAQVNSAWITTKIQGQYFTDTDVRGRRIDVTTNNGVVTLSGEVESEQERKRALDIARQTDGVRRVEDRLRVSGAAAATDEARSAGEAHEGESAEGAADAAAPGDVGDQRSDTGITTRVQSKFFTDDQVRVRNINVTTRDQVVTLQGTVQSEAERQQALSLARSVDGVRGVEDRLQVEGAPGAARPGDDESGAARSATDGVDDAWITTKIQSKYFLDDVVRATRVDVSAQRGIVTLTGEVESEAAKRRAEELARDTTGVMRVENRLTVNPAASRDREQPNDREPLPRPAPPQAPDGGGL